MGNESEKRVVGKGGKASSFIIPILLILCMFCAVVSIGLFQMSEAGRHIHGESLSALNLNAQAISQKVDDMYLSLESVAPTLAFETGFSQEQMMQSMTALHDACGFDFVVRTNMEGIAFNYLGKEGIDLSERQYIHDALAGQRACAYIDSGTYDPSSAYIILAVPIPYKGDVVGVLHGSYKVSNFDQMLRDVGDNDQNKDGDTFIIAMDGTTIAASNRDADCDPFTQTLLRGSESGDKDAESVAANLAAGQVGYLRVSADGQDRYYYYEPLTDIDSCQWVMVTAVDRTAVWERMLPLVAGTIALFIVAICITVVLIRSLIRRQRLAISQAQDAKTLATALDDARRANSAKSDFLSRMSHDMRTPLNGIIGMTYIAQEVDNPPRTQDCLAKIETSSKFLLGLINDVLDMSKAESGKMELHPEPYNIRQFTAYVEAVIKPLCTEKGIELVLDLKLVGNRKPLTDPLRFNQLFFNLLSNAVKYTPEGGTVTLKIHDRMVSDTRLSMDIEVSDTGIGMSEEFQKGMFEPFTQENRDDVSTTRGSGLGLAIVKRIVDLMDGTVDVSSAPGKGTSFRIGFEFDSVPSNDATQAPLDKVAVPGDIAVSSKDVSTSSEGAATSRGGAAIPLESAAESPQDATADYTVLVGKHVLLCEDHPLNQEIAQTLLGEKGMSMVTAENGFEGKELFSHSDPGYYSAILMDIRMPIMDGYTATQQIRSLDRPDAKSVPIIAMTADAFSDDISRCMAVGMNGHIAKPIEPSVLFQTLVEAIQSHS